jgi:ankyrin repeat protein
MTTPPALPSADPVARALTDAIQTGDVASLRRQLARDRTLAQLRIVDERGAARSLLHVSTDWPGHFPNIAETIAALAEAGADVNARMLPRPEDPTCSETPLHWAASSNDVAAIDALVDAGADIEAPGAVFTGGTPLSDAVIFANWQAARRLVERGAQITWWQGAALGALDVVRARWNRHPLPTPHEITRAFWHACRAAQRNTAEFLLAHGADPHWVGWEHKTPLRAAEDSGDAAFVAWLRGAV